MRDKFLTEAMGEAWWSHEVTYGRQGDKWLYKTQTPNNFATWQDFGKLWEWSQQQHWWTTLVAYTLIANSASEMYMTYINPDRFADAVYKYLKEKK